MTATATAAAEGEAAAAAVEGQQQQQQQCSNYRVTLAGRCGCCGNSEVEIVDGSDVARS